MDQRYRTRLLLAVSGILAVLLMILALLQYRWAGRVAEADAQRTLSQLQSAAGLFAKEFDLQIAQTYVLLQNQASGLLRPDGNGTPANLPRLVSNLYLLRPDGGGNSRLFQIGKDGLSKVVDTSVAESQQILRRLRPQGEDAPACGSGVLNDVPALLVPLPVTVIAAPSAQHMEAQVRLSGCIYAELDSAYLRGTFLPDLLKKNFGNQADTAYDFNIVSRLKPDESVFKTGDRAPQSRADLKQPFFSLRMDALMQSSLPGLQGAHGMDKMRSRVFIQSLRKDVFTYGRSGEAANSDPGSTGFWELQVFAKGGPIQSSLARWRTQNLLASLLVELLLLAGIGFIIVFTRRLQKLADQKMQFVAGVSHELRTPLAAVCTLSKNQADGLVNSPEQVRQYGALMYQEGQRLADMVEQTLQYAGIHSGRRKPVLNAVDVGKVVESALEARKSDLTRAGFEIQVEIAPDLPVVLGDAQALQKAIENLISNAEKYAKERRWIRISAWNNSEDRKVSITVEDQGIGIDPSDYNQIFEPFGRGRRAVEEQIPGTGIGLSLVRSTAEAHNGSVTFVSAPDRGSAFTLHLPAAASSR